MPLIPKTVLFLVVATSLLLISCTPVSETDGDQALAGEASATALQRTASNVERLSDEELASLQRIMKIRGDPVTTSDKIKTAGKALQRIPAEQRLAIVDAEITKRITRTVTPCTSTKDCPFPSSQVCGRDEGGSKVCELPLQVVGSRCESDDECGEGMDCQVDRTWVGRCKECSAEPSCAGQNYVLSTAPCNEHEAWSEAWAEELGIFAETCYTCLVREDLMAMAECSEGWEMSLVPNGFFCWYPCFVNCQVTPTDPRTECVSACETVEDLSSPCPEGFTISEFISTSGEVSEYGYRCIFVGASRDDPICNQCGSNLYGVDTAGTGDVFCARRS